MISGSLAKTNTDTVVQFVPRQKVTGKIKVKTQYGEVESKEDFVFRSTQ